MIKKSIPPKNDRRGPSEDLLSYIHRTATLLEMWNVIESVGINREVVNKIFTTDEAVLELYQLIVKRMHHQREQEMIKRLTVDVDKLKVNSQTNRMYV
jgi:hypothetical protein